MERRLLALNVGFSDHSAKYIVLPADVRSKLAPQ
jgi:hypothetical protein